MFDDVGNVEDGAVVGWYVSAVGEEEMPTCSTACFRFAEITGIALCTASFMSLALYVMTASSWVAR